MSNIRYCSLDEAYGNYVEPNSPQISHTPLNNLNKSPEWQYGLVHPKEVVTQKSTTDDMAYNNPLRLKTIPIITGSRAVPPQKIQEQEQILKDKIGKNGGENNIEAFSNPGTPSCKTFMDHYKVCTICQQSARFSMSTNINPVVTNYKDLIILMSLGVFIIASLDKLAKSPRNK